MKLKIKITKEVLNATKMCGIDKFKLKGSEDNENSSNCAITYAFRKLFPKCITEETRVILYNDVDETITIAGLPNIVFDFILLFDGATPNERVKMKPFEFEIELTKEALELITIDEITKVLETSTTLEVV
jgi:hypothetical protein